MTTIFPPQRKQTRFFLFPALFFSLVLTGCLTSQKMDAYVSSRFNDELPKPARRKQEFQIQSTLPNMGQKISHTVVKTSHVLPLIVYWQYDYRHTCTLNPQ